MTKLTQSTDYLNSVLDALPIGVLLVDAQQRIRYSNKRIEDLLDYSHDDLQGIDVHSLVPVPKRKGHREEATKYLCHPVQKAMDHGRVVQALNSAGQAVEVQVGLIPVPLGDQNYVLVSMIDPPNKLLRVGSYSDPLTGLPNRNLFRELSANLRELALRHETSLCVAFLDLDNFKAVNDSYGHAVGDDVLKAAADKILASLRKNDIVGRIGGDEFVVCLSGIKRLAAAEAKMKRLMSDIEHIHEVDGQQIRIGVSIGAVISFAPWEITLDQMIDRADKLMYEAKHKRSLSIESC